MSALAGKVAFVTGGSRGIGLAIARRLLDEGARVAITATSDATLDRAARELAAGDAVLRTATERLGGVDILVNNAGVGVFTPVADMTLDQWHQVMETNVTGVFHCCHAAIPLLRSRGGGWIVNISSLSGTNPFPDAAAYCASKAALNAFSEALMQEVRHDGIRVACIAPGSVRTQFSHPLSSSGGEDSWKLAPDDVAQVVVDLVSHPSRSLPSRVEIRPSRPPKKK
jgi:3-oxoacyl-[acyl-carrier protein] reductase